MAFTRNVKRRIGDQSTIEDRKTILYSAPSFIPGCVMALSSASRVTGSNINNARFIFPTIIRGVYAASLRSLSLPMTFGNVLTPLSFTLTYTNVVAYPGSFTLAAGYYFYDNTPQTVTYATASATPSSNNLIYYILNYFGGGLASITVLAQTGAWNWSWDSSTGGAASTNVPAFFQLRTTTSLNWLGNGNPPDLSGCKSLAVAIPDLYNNTYLSSVVKNPNYFAVCPVDVNYGQVLTSVPTKENVSWLDSSKDISGFTVQITDVATNTLLPLVTDWIAEIQIYIDRVQGV